MKSTTGGRSHLSAECSCMWRKYRPPCACISYTWKNECRLERPLARSLLHTPASTSPLFIRVSAPTRVHIGWSNQQRKVSKSQSIFGIWHDNQHSGNPTHGHWRLPSSGLGTNPDGHLLPLCFAGVSYTHPPMSDCLSPLLVPNPAFQVAVERLQAMLNHCSFCRLPGSCFGHPTLKLFMLEALEAAPSPSGRRLLRSGPSIKILTLRLGSSRSKSVGFLWRMLTLWQWKTEETWQNAPWPLQFACRQKCFPAGTTLFLNGPPLVCDQLLHVHIQGNYLCSQTAQSQFDATALVALAEIRAPIEVEELAHVVACTGALIPTQPPSSSSAVGVNSLPCASSNKLPFQRSLGGIRLIVQEFATSLEVPTRTVFDMSIGP